MIVTLRDGATLTQDLKLDRIPRMDPRSLANYPIYDVLNHVTYTRGKTWQADFVLDQGREGACVGYSVAGDIGAEPKPFRGSLPELGDLALRIYRRAQQIDPWPGEGYSGTDITSGMKAAVELGYFKEYRWGADVDDLIAALIARSTVNGECGPAIVGVEWRDGMYETNHSGTVDISGSLVGYHAIMVRGVLFSRMKEPVFRWRNSWGTPYGVNGDGYIKASDLETILGSQPEIAFPIYRV